jgi:LmbE family N-acetylglucosaminyl deacetylase
MLRLRRIHTGVTGSSLVATKEADILVIAAHPDDSEFGAAGTVARWIKEGRRAAYLICTSGEKGTSDPDLTPESLIAIREEEQRAAARVLGVQEVTFLRRPDQGLEDTAEFRKLIVRMIRTFRPEIVMTSDPYRRYIWHRDHRIIGQVVLDAVFPYARDRLAYPDLMDEGLMPHKVRELYFWGAEDINYRSDITATFDLKIAALRCHVSQVREFNRGDPAEWLRQRCREMAVGEAFGLAEGFHRVEAPP